MLSIVIPTLNAAEELRPTLAAFGAYNAELGAGEIIIVDGGSEDGTIELARHGGARVITSAAGRGLQLSRGAEAARHEWLLFWHADTQPGLGWQQAVAEFISDPGNAERAAAFCFELNDTNAAARRLEKIVALRCRFFGLPYGDQGLLISKQFYEALGGFRSLPLMEDVDLVRRIGRNRLSILDVPAYTSADRYRRQGYWKRSARNLLCLSLYLIGVPVGIVSRLYG